MKKNLQHDYDRGELEKKDLDTDPFKQFLVWFEEAIEEEIPEPNAFSLATATKEGAPSCRTVLLKHVDHDGLLFFTNYESRKSRELSENPNAFLTFWWRELERQVCIEGNVEKVSREISAKYFASRPRNSQLSAWASKQGEKLKRRKELEDEFYRLDKFYKERPIPLPPFWGGFRVKPHRFEFWQGRLNRLHDRFDYALKGDVWSIQRLSP